MNIIRYHKEEEFNAIPEKNLIDFVRIQYGRERDVMDTWEKHFREVGSPFAVEAIGRELILWKERRA